MTLPISDRAAVAREVTGLECHIERENGMDFVCTSDGVWNPFFAGVPRARSQALALVEYLADHGTGNHFSGAMYCVKRRDAEGLMQMVHELMEQP
jgi:hypothetical protein